MTSEARPPLPPGLDLLWGRRGPGRRGPQRGLSVDDIVVAAIAIADGEGLEALSMARVAKELGFTPMALYRYVTSKDELLQLMWNASAKDAEQLVLEGDGWRAQLRFWATVQREILDRHPWITQMPMPAPPLAPNSMHFVERALETMEGIGLADSQKFRIIGLLSSYTLSEARQANDAARAAAAAAKAAAESGSDEAPGPPLTYEAMLRALVDEPTFPNLYRIAWSPASDRKSVV